MVIIRFSGSPVMRLKAMDSRGVAKEKVVAVVPVKPHKIILLFSEYIKKLPVKPKQIMS